MFKVIVTFGPSLSNTRKLRDIVELGPVIFRINGAHTDPSQLKPTVDFIRHAVPQSEIMVDLPGNKVRTGPLATPFRLQKGQEIEILPSHLNYPELWKFVSRGDFIFAADSTLKLEVAKVENGIVWLSVRQTAAA